MLENNTNLWSKDQKTNLLKKIQKIKKKEHLQQIFKIIRDSNHPYTKNKNGIFLFFHNLHDDTYTTIEDYINNIYNTYSSEVMLTTEDL